MVYIVPLTCISSAAIIISITHFIQYTFINSSDFKTHRAAAETLCEWIDTFLNDIHSASISLTSNCSFIIMRAFQWFTITFLII